MTFKTVKIAIVDEESRTHRYMNGLEFTAQSQNHLDTNGERLGSVGWICNGWSSHEMEHLIHLRDRQDRGQLPGDQVKVLQDRV